MEIRKYPYCGDSHNLIEFFLIVGFDYSFIPEKILKPIELSLNQNSTPKPKNLDIKIFEEFKTDEKPTILGCVSSDYKKNMFPLNEVLNFCFPSSPPIYHTDDDPLINIQYDPLKNNIQNIIFQNNSINGPDKITFNVYAYIFYENFTIKNKHKVFIPKAFITISQYPLFNFFKQLSSEIHQQFLLPALEIPMEIQIYNILNFIPAPIFDDETYILLPKNELSEYERQKNENDFLKLEHLKLDVNQLSGYPYFDINICEILNVLPFDGIIQTFLITFLEIQINVYSRANEILNLTMLILASFNYPFDTPYIWQIASVGIKEIYDHTDSKLIGKPTPSILGFNVTYSSEYEECLIDTPSHYSIDLDNKSIIYVGQDNEIDDNINKLFSYLGDVINFGKGNGPLDKIIINLSNKMKDISNKLSYNSANSNGFEFYTNNNSKLIINKNIQDAFYDFYIDILALIYPMYSLEKLDSPENGKYYKVVKKDFKDIDNYIPGLKNEEKLFLQILNDTLKIDSFSQFIELSNPIPILLSNYLFAENFLILKILYNKLENKSNKSHYILNISYMELMDKIYKKKKDKNLNQTPINFYNFFIYYKQHLAKIMGNIINSEHIEKTITPKKISYKYTKYELDNSIIVKYMHLLNNINQLELEQIFPYLSQKNSPVYKELKNDDIPNSIEAFNIEHKFIDYTELIKTCIIIIITLTTEKISIINFISIIKELFLSINFSIRKYINKIIYIYYNLCDSQIKKGNYNLLFRLNSYIELFEIIKQKGILPNSNLINLISDIITLYEKEKKDLKDFEEEKNTVTQFYKSIEKKSISQLYKLEIENSNNDNKKEILKQIENIAYDGNIKENEIKLHFTSDLISSKNSDIKSFIFSPKKLFKNCNKLFYIFNQTMDYKIIEDKQEFKEIIINLFYYVQNIPKINSDLINKFFLLCLFTNY